MKITFCFRLLCWLSALLLVGFGPVAYAQQTAIDQDRMERDIDIMEKVLDELFKSSPDVSAIRNVYIATDRTAQGSYVPGYGVLFIAPTFSGWVSPKIAYAYRSSPNVNVVHPAPAAVIVGDDQWAGRVYLDTKDKEKPDKIKDKPGKEKESTANASLTKSRSSQVNSDSVMQAEIDLVTRHMREFMVNYADAIGQLAPNDRILLIYNEQARGNGRFLTIMNGEETATRVMPRISAEVKREDLSSFRSGKISRKELESRIRINQDNPAKGNYAEYKVFAGILESLYPVSQEVPYRIRNISYHYLPSFGVIYLIDMNLRSEISTFMRGKPGDSWSINGKMERDSSQNQLKEEAYDQFKDDIRETLLDYGRTLRNLSSDQSILLSVSVPTCEGCQVPSRVNVSVKKSVLEAYEQNKLDRQQALDSISLSEK